MDLYSFSNFVLKIKEKTKLSYDFENDLIPSVRINSADSYKSKSYKRASVIIFCFQDNYGNISFPLIKRQLYDGVHSGQISLPGGKKDEKDKNLWETAKRELNEELGVSLSSIKKIKKFKNLYIPPSNFLVTPFLAFTKKSPDFRINKREVAELIIVKVEDLILLNKVDKRVTNSYLNNVKVPGYNINKNFIWGATAMILKEFKHILILSAD
tara:strand:- start:163 stop:798 length:636 start_codon:yes stop_codon:yes gene_type:complete